MPQYPRPTGRDHTEDQAAAAAAAQPDAEAADSAHAHANRKDSARPRRESIYLDGFAHKNPVPAACRIGEHLYTGVLTGRDPLHHTMPTTLDEQVRNIFAHVREVMRAAGGSTDNIIKLTVYLSDYRDRETLNEEWVRMFPDPTNRPTRQVMHAIFDGDTKVQADLVAVLAD